MTALSTITVRVPIAFRRRGGRKVIVLPDGTAMAASPARSGVSARADPTLVKALARAFRWKRMMDTGEYATISEIGAAETIDRSYVGAILRLTLLAPDIVEAILDGRQNPDVTLPKLLKPWPLEWQAQRAIFS